MSNKQRIKSFNEPAYRNDLNQGTKDAADAKTLDRCIKALNGLNSLELIEEFLTTKTGFKNVRMSADSLELLEEYETFKKLSGTIDLWDFNKDFSDYTPEYKNLLREVHTIYWSKEETKIITNLTGLLDKINILPKILRMSILENTVLNEYIFLDSRYSLYLGEKERAENKAKR
jgi:hypothetical protein